jgi:hypothetical protein
MAMQEVVVLQVVNYVVLESIKTRLVNVNANFGK